MTIFATLPADVRRALARAELRRRRAPLTLDEGSRWAHVVRFMSRAALAELEPLLAAPQDARHDLLDAEAPMLQRVLMDARERMLISRQPAPPAPPVSEWSAWRAHAELAGLGQATAEDLKAVEELLAEMAEPA